MIGESLTTTRRIDGNHAAVIFLHGFSGHTTETWCRFPELLAAEPSLNGWDIFCAGYESALRLDLPGIWSGDPSIPEIALQLATRARLPELRDYKSFAFVGHSMGGLALQWAMLDSAELRGRSSHLILFGTPSGGLVKARLGRFFKRQAKSMTISGSFIQDLRKRWRVEFGSSTGTTHPFTFVVAAGDRDEFVPASSSLGPFSDDIFSDIKKAVVPGNHLQIVKPDSADNESVQLVVTTLLGQAAKVGPWSSARVAVESRQFQKAIDQWLPHADELDDVALVMLALALESVGRQPEAIEVLTRQGNSDTDAMGVLAGRLKRRWIVDRKQEDAEHAIRLYCDAHDLSVNVGSWAQAYYHAINVSFMKLAFKDDCTSAEEFSRKALDYCERSKTMEKRSDRKWRLATEAEAWLMLGDAEAAVDKYAQALSTKPMPAPREIASMHQQATLLAQLKELDEETVARLDKVFRPGGD